MMMGFVPQPILQERDRTNSSKISFSSSVSFDDISATNILSFNLHNSDPESIDNINNSALSLWNSIIQPQSPFDLNLIVKNLTSIATSKPATESQSSQ